MSNTLLYILVSLIPILTALIYFHPGFLGRFWPDFISWPDDISLSIPNVLKLLGVLILSFALSFSLSYVVIHQAHIKSIVLNLPGLNDPASPAYQFIKQGLLDFGNEFRNFRHGMIHGLILVLFTFLPIYFIENILLGKSWRFLFIRLGYLVLTIPLMGGFICQFLVLTP
ncbi:MAG: DUF1761 family protein [Chitinophagales bacterium]|jgi:hypothetical protein|nr:DUF1761 family protein [Chitinophagales bacterium]